MEIPSAANSPVAVPEAAVRNELDSLLASPSLRDSDLLKRFLRYIVENTLAGEGDQLKEYRLGVEVFGRDSSFDPKLDPVVRMAARRLRGKLQEHYDNGGRSALVRIEVPKGAYATSFVTVAEPPVATSDDSHDRPRQQPIPESSSVAHRRMGALAVAFVLLLTIGAAVLYLRHSRFLQLKNQPPSLAVLPFLNLTGNPDNEYLSDGITDEITGSVAKAAGLRVVARTSAFKFKGKSEDVREIGRQLNVSSVLEGSIQTQGERLRITAQLIRTSDGYHVWSETYEREFKDTFEVENEISRALAAAMSARLSPAADNLRTHTVDPLAHELCLRGRYFGQRLSLDDFKRATSYFNQAIDRDPLYADAYTGLAAAYVSEGANALVAAAEVYPKARAAAERAIELNPNQPEAHAILANATFFYDWDLPGAERELKRAIELDPNSARAHQWYGILLYYSRRFDEAREQFQRAKELAPLAIQVDLTMVMLYEAEHNFDQGIELSRKILSEHDHFLARVFLASLYADKKQYPEAISEAQKAVAMASDDPDANLVLANIYVQSGQREQGLAIVRQFVDNQKALLVPFDLAVIYAILGDREQMYEWLDKMIEQRSPASLKLDIAGAFDPYRSEPRFQEILRQTGLPR